MNASPPLSTGGLALQPGTFLGSKFRVERVLGQGGMGIVVAATHLELQRPVAIKLLLPAIASDEGVVVRFLREARAQVRIQGDHVVRVLDVGTLPHYGPFMVMEMLHEMDLGEVLRVRGALSIADATDYILQVTDALAQAHSLGIIHRDLKPQNLFLTTQPDGSALVKVLDFGIAKVLVRDGTLNAATHAGVGAGLATSTGGLLGSPAYMSPEQIQSAKDVTRATDIWSLGVILYELYTNQIPFNADNLGGLLTAIVTENPIDVRVHRPDLPESIASMVMRCLSKDIKERPRDVAELALGLAYDAASHERAMRIAQIVRRLSNRPPPLDPNDSAEMASTVLAPPPASAWVSTIAEHGDGRDNDNAAAMEPAPLAITVDTGKWQPSSMRWVAVVAAVGIAIVTAVVMIGISQRLSLIDARVAQQQKEQHQQQAAPLPAPSPSPAPAPTPSIAPAPTPRVEPAAAPSASVSAARPTAKAVVRGKAPPASARPAAPPSPAAAEPDILFDSRK